MGWAPLFSSCKRQQKDVAEKAHDLNTDLQTYMSSFQIVVLIFIAWILRHDTIYLPFLSQKDTVRYIQKKVNIRYSAAMRKHSNILSLHEEIIGRAT